MWLAHSGRVRALVAVCVKRMRQLQAVQARPLLWQDGGYARIRGIHMHPVPASSGLIKCQTKYTVYQLVR